MAEQNKYRWYVLRSISGKELKVKEMIEAEMRGGLLGDYVQEIVVPTEKVISQTASGKKTEKEKVLFSGYVFVKCNLTGEIQNILANTTNVVNFLCGRNSKRPEALRDDEIANMLGSLDKKVASEDDINVSFVVGEAVKVLSRILMAKSKK